MPVVTVDILPGATRDQKAALVADITESLRVRLGKNPEHTHVIIREVPEDNWGYGGLLTAERRARAGA